MNGVSNSTDENIYALSRYSVLVATQLLYNNNKNVHKSPHLPIAIPIVCHLLGLFVLLALVRLTRIMLCFYSNGKFASFFFTLWYIYQVGALCIKKMIFFFFNVNAFLSRFYVHCITSKIYPRFDSVIINYNKIKNEILLK